MIKIIDINFQGFNSAVACFLIKSENNLILIETGPSNSYSKIKERMLALGEDINKINHVFVTHIHLDHSGGAWRFAKNGAIIYVHPKGAPHLENPEKLIASATMIYGNKMEKLWGKVDKIDKNQIYSVKDYEEIKIDNYSFKALYTPGHANHHIAWKLDNIIFTGDVAGAKIKNGPVMPACPPPDIDLELWEKSIKIIEEEKPEKLYLTHFGAHQNIKAHFDELRKNLNLWFNWIKENNLKYKDNDILTIKFNNYVLEEMKKENIEKELIDQYFAANPPYMSVSGIKRYWYKKNENK